MKKLILLAALAAGVAYVVKFKSGQVKAAATRVTHDPRVQSALATTSDKAGPVASAVTAHLHRPSEQSPASEPSEVNIAPPAEGEVPTEGQAPRKKPDPLTDPLDTIETPEEPAP